MWTSVSPLTSRNLPLYSFVRLPRKAIIYQVHLPSYLRNSRSDWNASPGCCCGQSTLLVIPIQLCHIESWPKDRHSLKKHTTAFAFRSPSFLPGSHSTGPWVCSYSNATFHVHFFAWSPLFCVEAGSALCRWGGLASRSCPHFEKPSFNVNRTSLGTPVCCCHAKMCSKIGSSLSLCAQD